jgi:basic membrane lipoprotein Med (substrate-binding protein (PBP1-ABC) superfamily)
MFAAIIKRLDVAFDLILNRLQAVQRWVAAIDTSTQDVLFLQEKMINLRAIHSEYHTKIDELFAEIPDEKNDERTAKVFEFDDI